MAQPTPTTPTIAAPIATSPQRALLAPPNLSSPQSSGRNELTVLGTSGGSNDGASSARASIIGESAAPPTYEEQVVAFFRQPDIVSIISSRYQRGVRPQLRDIITGIRMEGTTALERIQMSGSIATYELAIVLSLFEEEISRMNPQAIVPPLPLQPAPNVVPPQPSTPTPRTPSTPSTPGSPAKPPNIAALSTLQRKKLDFSTKLQNFKIMMTRLEFSQGSRLKFNIHRDHLLKDAYEHVMKSNLKHLQMKRLNISFKGEEGLDYGGPSREFFFLLSHEIFNPYYGLFEYSANDTYRVQISPTSSFIHNNMEWFRFAGRIVGLVIAQGFLLDVFFTRTVYKSLLCKLPCRYQVVLWFWHAVEMFDNEQRLRLLQFVTGMSSVPFEGFKALRGSNEPRRFTIDFFNDANAFPRTHTYFNRIDLPPYPSFEVLYEKLRFTVEEGGGFGIE